MNAITAEKCLETAATLITQADAFAGKANDRYVQAVAKIQEAKELHLAETGKELSNRAIAKVIGKSHTWVNQVLTAAETGNNVSISPYSDQYPTQKARIQRNAVQDMTPEQVVDAVGVDLLKTAAESVGLIKSEQKKGRNGPREKDAKVSKVARFVEVAQKGALLTSTASDVVTQVLATEKFTDDDLDQMLREAESTSSAWEEIVRMLKEVLGVESKVA